MQNKKDENKKLLIVEDEHKIANSLKIYTLS